MRNWILKLLELSDRNKWVNWTGHGLVVVAVAGLTWVMALVLTPLGIGATWGLIGYHARELEVRLDRWFRGGPFVVSTDNLGDLLGPWVAWLVIMGLWGLR